MELFVHKYLSQNYYIKPSDVGNYGIYYRFSEYTYLIPTYASTLIDEINLIFCINEDVIKDYITNWASSIKPDIDLEFYWKTYNIGFDMPLAQRVAAQTIGLDLVAVQPMAGPVGNLLYLDYQYDGGNPLNQNVEIVEPRPPVIEINR